MDHGRSPKWIPWLFAASLLLGFILRLLWSQDMEFKADEQYMFARALAVGRTEPWPWLGMPSGVGLRNPGMSIWIFVVLARIAGVATPVGLTQAVMVLNCLALLFLAYLALRVVSAQEREPWLWALMLVAVNPVAIQLQRKIWAQSVLPIFCVLFLWSWMKRKSMWGAFFWGLIGACLGQIHMSGFFFALAFFGWTAWKDGLSERKVSWKSWFAGSLLGALTLIPWLAYVFSEKARSARADWQELLTFRFWQEWGMQSLGFSVRYSLGGHTFRDFLKGPLVAGYPTFAMGAAHALAILAGIAIFVLGFRLFWSDRDRSNTVQAQNAAFFGFGGLMTAARVYVHRHYLIVAYPLQYLWIGRMALAKAASGRTWLVLVWVSQLVISAGFLTYIHQHGGAPEGDYGVAYSMQRHADAP